MNELSVGPKMVKRMTSLEIADLTEKTHRHVMPDIRTLIEQGAITETNFGLSEYKDASGKTNPMYSLDHQGSMTTVSGYNAILRSRIIARWIELEQGKAGAQNPNAGRSAPTRP